MAATSPDLPKTGYHASYSALVRTSRTAAGPPRRPASTHAGGTDDAIQARTEASTTSSAPRPMEQRDEAPLSSSWDGGQVTTPSSPQTNGPARRGHYVHPSSAVAHRVDPTFGHCPQHLGQVSPLVRLYILSCLRFPGLDSPVRCTRRRLRPAQRQGRTPVGIRSRIRYTYAIAH